MATFTAQVVDLVGAFSDETALDSFITEGANEVINAMPRDMQERVAEETSFTTTTTSEGSKILHVLRDDGTIHQPCRKIPASKRGRIQDSSDMEYATATDPAYYVQDAAVTIFPTGTGKLVSIPTYNQGAALDASSLSTITNFPNEAEYLVTLYAAIKALQQNMSGKLGNEDISTALTAINTELDETQAVCDKIDADLVLAKAEIVLAKAEAAEIASNTDNSSNFETACDAMATELNKVDNIILEASTEFDKVDNVIVEGSVEFDKSDALLDLGEVDSEAAVNTAITLLLAAVAQAETAADGFQGATESVFGDEDTFLTANSQLTRVKAAVDNAENVINNNQPSATTDAYGAQANEDIELVNSALNIAQTEIQRSQAHLAEWVSIGDMRVKEVNAALAEADGQVKSLQAHFRQAESKRQESQARLTAGGSYLQEANSIIAQGNAYLQEAQSYIAQASGYANEVGARSSFVAAKSQAVQGYIETAKSYVATAQGFANEIQSKVGIAQGYSNEVQMRLAVDSAEYSWYEKQQAKLQADYDRGIQLLRAG